MSSWENICGEVCDWWFCFAYLLAYSEHQQEQSGQIVSSEVQVSVVGEQTHLFTATLVSDTLEHLNVHLFNASENGATHLSSDGVVLHGSFP